MPKKPTLKDKQIREYRAFSSSNNNVSSDIDDSIFNPEKEMDKTFKNIERRAALIHKFKTIEPHLPKEEALEFKKQLGLIKEDEEGNTKDTTDEGNLPLMLEVLKTEKDPQVRQQLAMALMSKKGGMDSNMMMLAMMMNGNNTKKGDDFKDRLLDEILRERLTGGGKNPNDSLKDAMETIKLAQEMVGGGGNPLDDLIEQKKKMEELGLVGAKGNSIDEKKLDLDFKKFEFEKTREAEKEESDAEFKKKAINEAIKALPKVLSLVSKKGQEEVYEEPKPEPEPQEQSKSPIQTQVAPTPQEDPIDIIEKKCDNPECRRMFTITHINEPRYVYCPNIASGKCDTMYEIRKDGQIASYKLSDEDLQEAIKSLGGDVEGENDEEKHD